MQIARPIRRPRLLERLMRLNVAQRTVLLNAPMVTLILVLTRSWDLMPVFVLALSLIALSIRLRAGGGR